MTTARNARGIDIIAYKDGRTRPIAIQVKTLSKENNVPLGKSLANIMGDYWIIVNNVATEEPTAFILLPEEVKEMAKPFPAKNTEGSSFWLRHGAYNEDRFRNAWPRIKEQPIT